MQSFESLQRTHDRHYLFDHVVYLRVGIKGRLQIEFDSVVEVVIEDLNLRNLVLEFLNLLNDELVFLLQLDRHLLKLPDVVIAQLNLVIYFFHLLLLAHLQSLKTVLERVNFVKDFFFAHFDIPAVDSLAFHEVFNMTEAHGLQSFQIDVENYDLLSVLVQFLQHLISNFIHFLLLQFQIIDALLLLLKHA